MPFRIRAAPAELRITGIGRQRLVGHILEGIGFANGGLQIKAGIERLRRRSHEPRWRRRLRGKRVSRGQRDRA